VALALGCGPTDEGNLGSAPGPGPGGSDIDAGGPGGGPTEIGGACACDADCPADGSNPGVCVLGVCMTRASGACSAAGSTAECGTGSRCWNLEGVEGGLCFPDCDSHSCDGACDSDGSCVPTQDTNCSLSCADLCSCESNDDCQDGEACIQGSCIQAAGDGPGEGPGASCTDLPERDCVGSEAYCGELISFDPRTTPYYDDYPINGETTSNQYRSYLRRSTVMLLEHVTALVECKTAAWKVGNGGALGLGDMSESNGAIPGTSVDSPGHPAGTHVDGRDIDLGYYQLSTPDNRLRPICNYVDGGQNQYHCVGDPVYLDVWRNALFLGYLFDSPITRVVGVDGKAGSTMASALTELCATGWLSQFACNRISYKLAFETTNGGAGWYLHHHHHQHLSTCAGECANLTGGIPGLPVCNGTGCETQRQKVNPHLYGRGKFSLRR
jgi:hypothetical protein